MRFRRTKDNFGLVVGIFQSPEIGRTVLKNLRRARFRRVAVIYASATGRLRVDGQGISAIGGAATAAAVSLALGASLAWQRGMLADYRPAGLALLSCVRVGWRCGRLDFFPVAPSARRCCEPGPMHELDPAG